MIYACSLAAPIQETTEELIEDIDSVIYQGLQTTIWSLHHTTEKVVKEIPIGNLKRDALEAFEANVCNLTRIDYPCILRYDQVVKHEGSIYLQVKRYATSLDVCMRMHRTKWSPFSRARIIAMTRQIAAALAYLQDPDKKGTDGLPLPVMIHGRLKPGDILVDAKEEEFVLSDPGFSHRGIHGRTLAYMSPEVVAGEIPSSAADMWSLGVIIYELTVGYLPQFSADGNCDLSRVADDLTAAILMCLLAQNPAHRLCARDLCEILNDDNIPTVTLKVNCLRIHALECEVASLRRELVILRQRLEQRAPVQRENGLTNLMHAAHEGNIATLQQLIASKTSFYAHDKMGQTALMHAVRMRQYEAIKMLAGIEFGLYDNRGQTALMYAVQSDDLAAINLLTPYEARQKATKKGLLGEYLIKERTALMEAAARNNVRAVKELVRHEAGLRDENGRTALMHATSQGHLDVVQLLVNHEARCQDNDGNTALILAVQKNFLNIAEVLITEAKLKTVRGYTALMIAANRGYTDIARLLVKAESQIRNLQFGTALITAAYNNHPDIVKLLIPYESGLQNRFGLTALMEAAKHGHTDVVLLLAQHEKGIRDNRQRTALMIAHKFGNIELENFLSRYPEELGMPANS